MLHKSESAALRLIVTLVHLALWAELGVASRAFLDQAFTLGCDGGWMPCFQSGVYFKDMPANMLGSFVIGLLAASTTVGVASDKQLLLLPAGHPWQHNFELQIGLRTGYCGCLTTFASWNLELMVLAIQQNKWVEAVWGYLTGIFSALVCYHVGMHMALAIDDALQRRQDRRRKAIGRPSVLGELGRFREAEVEFIEGLRPDQGLTESQKLMLQAEPDLPRLVPNAAEKEDGGRAGEAGAQHQQQNGTQQQQQQQPAERLTFALFRESMRGYRTDLVALLLLLALTAALAAGLVVEERHAWLRTIWAGCLLGPFGCVLRWLLSKWNYRLPGKWAWLPGGTLAANMLGTTIDFGLECILQRSVSVGYWGSLWISAVTAGFCGSLTTVSTFVSEVAKLADAIPDNLRAYTYTALSLGGGVLLGLAIYGWSVWT